MPVSECSAPAGNCFRRSQDHRPVDRNLLLQFLKRNVVFQCPSTITIIASFDIDFRPFRINDLIPELLQEEGCFG